MAKATFGCEGCPNQVVFTANSEFVEEIVASIHPSVPKTIVDNQGSSWSDTEYGQKWCEKLRKDEDADCGFSRVLKDERYVLRGIVNLVN